MDRGFLNVYVFFIGINAISAIVLILKCASTEWSRLSPEGRARRERAVLICDMVCDALCTYSSIMRSNLRPGRRRGKATLLQHIYE